MKLTKKALALLLALIMTLSLLPAVTLPASASAGGNIVISFEVYDPTDNTIGFLREPEKVSFTSGQKGNNLLDAFADEDVDVTLSGDMITSITFEEYLIVGGPDDMLGETGYYWSMYLNNAPSKDMITQYAPKDGDVYRIIYTVPDFGNPTMYPVMPHDMDALYWAIAESQANLDATMQFVQGETPAQTAIDSAVAALCTAGGAHRVLLDGRTIDIDSATYPYTYTPTLAADRTTASLGDTVTVTVTPVTGYQLKAGTLKANGVDLAASGTAGQYTFSMPDCHVTVTAEYELIPSESTANKIKALSFMDDGGKVIPLDPAFDKGTLTGYVLNIPDSVFGDDYDDEHNLHIDAEFDTGTEVKFKYYADYGGGPMEVASQALPVPAGFKRVNLFCGASSFENELIVTPPSAPSLPAQTYKVTMNMLPTLSALGTNAGTMTPVFSPTVYDYRIVVPDSTASITLSPTLRFRSS